MQTISSRLIILLLLAAVAAVFQGCGGTGGKSSSGGGGYGYGDGPPPKDVDVTNIPDAVPKVEPITKAGNKSPYEVFGKTYEVLPTSLGFRQRGMASWYGNKFHGQSTSNGEAYSMYEMTAAHKTLPIPCYVRVTNLENGRSVIVRVNDRGPFHGDRIIDLSYVAAKKLGYSDRGTAQVAIETIDPRQYQNNSVEQPQIYPQPSVLPSTQPVAGNDQPLLSKSTFLQVGAFSTPVAASSLSQRVQGLTDYPVVVRQLDQPKTIYKVLVGPVSDSVKLLNLSNLLKQRENISTFVVYE
ncbi:septal ring lytic transglycosylase RlpA family protein [Porticoccus sp.]